MALAALGTFGFSLGNMLSVRHQKHGLDVFTTNAYAMLYGTLVLAMLAALFDVSLAMPMQAGCVAAAVFGGVWLGDWFYRVFHVGQTLGRGTDRLTQHCCFLWWL